MPIGISVRRADFSPIYRNIIDCRAQPVAQSNIHPAHASKAQIDNRAGGDAGPGCQKKNNREFLVGNSPFPDDDNLLFGDPIVFTYRKMEPIDPFVADGDS